MSKIVKSEREKLVVDVVSTILKRNVEATDDRARINEWDSLKHIEIIFALEEVFEVQIPEEKLNSLNSVPQILKCVGEIYGES